MTYGKAVVLLSGGIDSLVAAAMLKPAFEELHGVTVDYGQRHVREVDCAREVGAWLGLTTHVVEKVSGFPPSPLTGSGPVVGIPCVVPGRNAVFLSLALSHAIWHEADAIIVGANADDVRDYLDCRSDFFRAFDAIALVLGYRIQVLTPCGGLDKAGVLAVGNRLGVPLRKTLSCYDPPNGGCRCHVCNSCQLLGAAEAKANVVV